MSKKDLQRKIREGEGYILSDGTLNLEHLLPKAHDFICKYNIRKTAGLLEEIRNCFTNPNVATPLLSAGVYYGVTKLREDRQEEASYLWNENIFNLFNDISPAKYYFGSHEGDGACIGWFKCEQED